MGKTKNNAQGIIYMIPCPIAENATATIPQSTLNHLHQLDHFIVERTRTARRYIKEVQHPIAIDDMEFLELDKHIDKKEIKPFLLKAKEGISIGVISEAGCPGVADPGAEVVAMAHREGITVVPLVGPSSILLALMASGMNGQSFSFNGYLPNKNPDLSKTLKSLESKALSGKTTQIFMDVPYRNEFLLTTCIESLKASTRMCVAVDLGADSEFIQTKSISEWDKNEFKNFHKRPAIVLIGG